VNKDLQISLILMNLNQIVWSRFDVSEILPKYNYIIVRLKASWVDFSCRTFQYYRRQWLSNICHQRCYGHKFRL